MSEPDPTPRPLSPHLQIPDDLSIPAFLRRTLPQDQQPEQKLAA
jgi:hypothetical protein